MFNIGELWTHKPRNPTTKRACLLHLKHIISYLLSFFLTVVWSWCSQYTGFFLFSISHNRWDFTEFSTAVNKVKCIWFKFQSSHQTSFSCAKICYWRTGYFLNMLLGSFSRSAVNHESGAKTGLSGVITGIILACALLFMTPLFEHIPQVSYQVGLFAWQDLG